MARRSFSGGGKPGDNELVCVGALVLKAKQRARPYSATAAPSASRFPRVNYAQHRSMSARAASDHSSFIDSASSETLVCPMFEAI